MANLQQFDNLVEAIQSAVVHAHTMVQGQHQALIDKTFFLSEEDLTEEQKKDPEKYLGMPRMIDLKLPNTDPKVPDDYNMVKIPVISITPINAIKMKEVRIKTKIRFSEDKDGKLLYKLGGKGVLGEYGDVAEIEMAFEAGEPPEGLMRVTDTILKALP